MRLEVMSTKYRPFLVYQAIIINEKPIMMNLCFFTPLKVPTETFKTRKNYLFKINLSHYIPIASKL